jgi:hypothetical protein
MLASLIGAIDWLSEHNTTSLANLAWIHSEKCSTATHYNWPILIAMNGGRHFFYSNPM